MTIDQKQQNRKERKELARRLRSEDPGLEVVHPHAAGVDVGNSAHYVAVRPDRDSQPVRRFECFTADLHHLADWLQNCGVTTVALQSTGVYWIPLYDILEERGFEVYLVNARHTKNLPGRKSDVQESQWLLKLHTHGLLNNSFQPTSEIRVLRTYWRQWAEHARGIGTCILRMQKALTQMNLQLANVISDLSGVTGQEIVRAIVAGERDPRKLAELSDPRIHASKEEIAKSLEGNWRQDLLFVLHQEVDMYDVYQRRIAECDQQLQQHMASFADTVPPQAKEGEPQKKKAKPNKNTPQFHLSSELQRITGVDLTRIDGIDVMVAQTLVSEVGLDMSRWETDAHFASWLGLCPDNRISGDRVLSRGTRHVVNRAATALRIAATTLLRNQTYLGAQYRRLRSKLGAPKAITAMAHRLARLVYRMLKYGQQYVDKGALYYEQRNANNKSSSSERRQRNSPSELHLPRLESILPRSFWGGGVPVTHLRKIILEELQRRHYSQATTQRYIRFIQRFAQHFHRSPDRLGPQHIREYQACEGATGASDEQNQDSKNTRHLGAPASPHFAD